MEKYYKKPAWIFKVAGGKRTLKLQTFPTLNLLITFDRQNKEERLHINFVQVVAPSSPPKKIKVQKFLGTKKNTRNHF